MLNGTLQERHDSYRLARQQQRTLEGIFPLAEKGYGFLRLDDTQQENIFIPARHIGNAMDGDRVLAACQGVDFREPLKTSDLLEQAKQLLRNEVPFYDQDRYFAPDIEKAKKLVQSGDFSRFVGETLLPSS